jgi:D-cysteine desulfhydrase
VLSQVRLEPRSLFGYVAAGLELAAQVRAGECPVPARVVLPVGSGASSAGILAGLSLAGKLGFWPGPVPCVAAVRIAPWPLSRRARVLSLAEKTLASLARLTGNPALALPRRELAALELITDQLGRGYPHPTEQGAAARLLFARADAAVLDDTYSAKAAAHALELARGGRSNGPLLFWCTKSSAPLPVVPAAAAD